MWYSQARSASRQPEGMEEKILRIDAERVIRRVLRLQGQTTPSRDDVNGLVNRTITYLSEHFGSLNNVRLHVNGESLTPAVEDAVRAVLPKKRS